MHALTIRSKITVRWTTNPADLGYDGTPSDWMSSPGEVMGLRAAANFDYQLGQRVGQGTYRAVSYQHRGREVSLSDIRDVIAESDYRRQCA